MTEISKWLDKEFNHSIIPINYRLTYKKIDNYYFENSKEILINDTNKIDDLKKFGKMIKMKEIPEHIGNLEQNKLIIESNLIQLFELKNNNYYIYLNPKTPRYHANMLFNKLIDYCIHNEYYDHKGNTIINLLLRNQFYKFCYENTNIT